MLRRVLMALLFIPLLSNAQQIQNYLYGGGGADQGNKLIEVQQGGYLIVGSTSSFGLTHTQAFIQRVDDSFQNVWTATYGGLGVETLVDVIEVSTGGYAAVGYTTSQWSGDYDGYLLRFDDNGTLQYAWQYGGLDWDLFTGIAEGQNGQFYISGNSQSYGDGSVDGWLLEYRENQSPKPFLAIVYADSNYQSFNDVLVQADGAVIVSGEEENGLYGGLDGLVVKYTDDLVEVDKLVYGSAQDDGFTGIQQFSDGTYALSGYEHEPAGRRGGMGVKAPVDLDTVDWKIQHYYDADVIFNDLVVNAGDTVVFVGTMIGTDGKHQVMLFGNTFFNGFLFTAINGAAFKNNYGRSIISHQDGYIYAGTTDGFSAVYDDVIVGSLDNVGAGDNSSAMDLKVDSTNITSVPEQRQEGLKVYPTLIAPGVRTIQIDGHIEGEITLIDMSGRRIVMDHSDKTIFLPELSPGVYLLMHKEDNVKIVAQ